MQSKVAVLRELRNFHIEIRSVPSPSFGNVIVQIYVVGICGSDVHYWAHGKCGKFELEGPIILGHECSGMVVAIGDGVKNLKKGDRVAIEPGVPCRVCVYCRAGSYNLCQEVKFLATPPCNGSISTYIEHAADFCYKMPDHVSFEEGALLEPMSVGLYALRQAGVKVGSRILITGCGVVGLLSLLVAKASGARVIVTDPMEGRLEFALKLGAEQAIISSAPDIFQKISEFAPSVTLECSGADSALVLAIRTTSPGGKIISIGRGAKEMQNIPVFELADKELSLCGSFRYSNCYPTAMELVSSGRVNVKPLVTHRFDLEDSQKAFITAQSGEGIKITIHVSKEAKL